MKTFHLWLRRGARAHLSALFIFAGTLHLFQPAFFLPIMPPAIPFPIACIEISGVFELLGGLGLWMPLHRIQLLTGWGLIVLLLAVFPANVYMAAANVKIHGMPSQPWMAWARLPLQPLLIVAVTWVTGIWPKRCNKSGDSETL
jgi:uncharacterized membrane protein